MSSDAFVLTVAAQANKYSRGKLVVVAGSARYPGAAVLAARAGQRMGAGYTEVVCAPESVDVVRLSSPSLVVGPFSAFDPKQLSDLRPGHPKAVCIGPGFVAGAAETDELVVSVLKHAHCPVLVDGGALGCLGSKQARKQLSKRADKGFPTVITPHGGEAARLARDASVAATAPVLADALHAVVALKGPDTYISDGQRTVAMLEGTPALAKAGTGDVLAGMISSLLAQGAGPFDAAVSGATLHARAGIVAAEALTETCVCAEDLIDYLPVAIMREELK